MSVVYGYHVACVRWQRLQECGKPLIVVVGHYTLGTVNGGGLGRFVA